MTQSPLTYVVDNPALVFVSIGVVNCACSIFNVLIPTAFILSLTIAIGIGPETLPAKILTIALIPIPIRVDDCPLCENVVLKLPL